MPTTMLPNSFILNPISPQNSISVRICYPNIRLNRLHSRKSTITYARSTNKGFLSSPRSRKTLISLVRFAASNLHYVLPAPFNTVIRELNIDGGNGGGDGGSGGSWKGFRWGGFDGRKRKPNKKSQFWFWGFMIVCCLGFWLLILGEELELELKLKNDAVLATMCLSMFLVLIHNGLVPEWVLGFCSGGVLVGLILHKKDELQKLVKGLGIARRRYLKIK